jgi:hypothetical protein
MVKTRNQLKSEQLIEYGTYEVNIDFDEASEAWNANKIRCQNGEYKYVCGESTNRGYCKRKLCANTNKCSSHKNKN